MRKTEAVYQYISQCCKAKATKDPCEKTGDPKHPTSLGTWRCTTCRQKCKVDREKNAS